MDPRVWPSWNFARSSNQCGCTEPGMWLTLQLGIRASPAAGAVTHEAIS
jgi:hypothetical protein